MYYNRYLWCAVFLFVCLCSYPTVLPCLTSSQTFPPRCWRTKPAVVAAALAGYTSKGDERGRRLAGELGPHWTPRLDETEFHASPATRWECKGRSGVRPTEATCSPPHILTGSALIQLQSKSWNRSQCTFQCHGRVQLREMRNTSMRPEGKCTQCIFLNLVAIKLDCQSCVSIQVRTKFQICWLGWNLDVHIHKRSVHSLPK